jgi:phosphoglycerate kinase
MAFSKKTVRDIDLSGKRVLVRVDYNVPVDAHGKVQDDLRIRSGLPTLQYLIERDCRLVLMSHLGRPEGKPDPALSLRDAAGVLSKLLKQPVDFVDDCLKQPPADSRLALLENLRFYPEEEANDRAFAKKLAGNGEVYVDDAFGAVHRANASLAAITEFLPAVAGLLLEHEVDTITDAVEHPKQPLIIVLGGAKIADKIELIDNFLPRAGAFLIGGAMANTFLAAAGRAIGKSKYDADGVSEAKRIVEHARRRGVKILLPEADVVVGQSSQDAAGAVKPLEALSDSDMILDIGPESLAVFRAETDKAGTVIWNGTLGMTEFAPFAKGSRHFAESLARSKAEVIIGGGDTAGFIDQIGMLDKFTHVSTGGGASLELMAGKTLPGVAALLDK